MCVTYYKHCITKSNSDIKNVILFATWMFFTLVNAYYGGALTMFFISDTEIPFKTVTEALRQPNWKFIFNTGEEAIFVFPAKQVKMLKKITGM